MKDENKEFADVSETNEGSKLQADNGFTCLDPNEIVEVKSDEYGKFVLCREGHHYLDAQIYGSKYAGFYIVKDAE